MTTGFWAADRVYVCIVRDREPTDSEWAGWIDLCTQRKGQDVRVLVESYKTGPNAKQRKALEQAITDSRINYRAAILTESLITRGIVTAFAWLGVQQRAFPPNHYAEAGNYLEYTPAELETAIQELLRLRVPSMRYAPTG